MLSDLKLAGTAAVSLSLGSSSALAATATFTLTTVARSILPRNWYLPSSRPCASSKRTSLSQNSKLDKPGQPWSCNPRWLPPLPTLCKSYASRRLKAAWSVFCVDKKSCRPNCAVSTCAHMLFLCLCYSCTNCHVACYYNANNNNRQQLVRDVIPRIKFRPLRYLEDTTWSVQASEAPSSFRSASLRLKKQNIPHFFPRRGRPLPISRHFCPSDTATLTIPLHPYY